MDEIAEYANIGSVPDFIEDTNRFLNPPPPLSQELTEDSNSFLE